MKKIFVTGGSGFIGSNFIINQLNNSENQIFNLDKLTYAGNNENLSSISKNKNYSFMQGDISDKNIVKSVFNDFLPDIIVNFAAETHVDRSIDGPSVFIETNVIGTLNLLNISQDYFQTNSSFRFIHISTDEVFGSLDYKDNPFNETSRFNPSSPYAASKASSDHLIKSWYKTFDLPTIISNCSNNYGPFQFPEKLIPLMIANCIDKKPLPIYGNGDNIRDWLFVEDHCNAISSLIISGRPGETYNIGGNNEIKNKDIVAKICTILDDLRPMADRTSYKKLITFVEDRPGHDKRYAIDSSKIKNELNWKPIETFETGIFKTVKWYLENGTWLKKIQKKSYGQERLGLKQI